MAFSRARLVHYNYGEEHTLHEHIVTRRVKANGPFLLSPSDATRYASKEALYRERQPYLGETGPKLKKATFKAPIRVGPKCGSQILLTEEVDVAKVYDPLCYRFVDIFFETKVDVVNKAEYEFQKEGCAYSLLRDAGLCGRVVPKYLGSWTITIADPTARDKDREVHLILTECIEGVAMSEVPVEALSKEIKDEIMIEVMEAYTDVYLAGVYHGYEPYDIILPDNYESVYAPTSNQTSHSDNALRVHVVDFELARTRETECSRPKDCRCRKCNAKIQPNPLYVWAGDDKFGQYGWLPRVSDRVIEWMWKIWVNRIRQSARL